MKKVKRILAIVFLILVIWEIGYLCLTGSRLFFNDGNEDTLKGTFYQYNNKVRDKYILYRLPYFHIVL